MQQWQVTAAYIRQRARRLRVLPDGGPTRNSWLIRLTLTTANIQVTHSNCPHRLLGPPAGPHFWGLGLSELQCSEPGWLVRQGVGSSPTPASMSSQVSACYDIKFSGRYRGFACVLFKLWQAITTVSGASGMWWEPPVWITDGRGQRSYRKTAYRHPARETHRLS